MDSFFNELVKFLEKGDVEHACDLLFEKQFELESGDYLCELRKNLDELNFFSRPDSYKILNTIGSIHFESNSVKIRDFFRDLFLSINGEFHEMSVQSAIDRLTERVSEREYKYLCNSNEVIESDFGAISAFYKSLRYGKNI